MSTFTLPITKKGSITIPKKAREYLGIDVSQPFVKIILELDEVTGKIQIKTPIKSISQLTKSIKPRKAIIPESKFKQALEEDRAEKYLKK